KTVSLQRSLDFHESREAEPHPLWEYPCRALTQSAAVMTFDFTQCVPEQPISSRGSLPFIRYNLWLNKRDSPVQLYRVAWKTFQWHRYHQLCPLKNPKRPDVFWVDGKQRNAINFLKLEQQSCGTLQFQASVSVLLSRTIFSPGLNAGIPMYGQLAQRKASPRLFSSCQLLLRSLEL
ncbi:hypothetical protein XENOCAPTIV_029297, partial [Xenoophorus captivus]